MSNLLMNETGLSVVALLWLISWGIQEIRFLRKGTAIVLSVFTILCSLVLVAYLLNFFKGFWLYLSFASVALQFASSIRRIVRLSKANHQQYI